MQYGSRTCSGARSGMFYGLLRDKTCLLNGRILGVVVMPLRYRKMFKNKGANLASLGDDFKLKFKLHSHQALLTCC